MRRGNQHTGKAGEQYHHSGAILLKHSGNYRFHIYEQRVRTSLNTDADVLWFMPYQYVSSSGCAVRGALPLQVCVVLSRAVQDLHH